MKREWNIVFGLILFGLLLNNVSYIEALGVNWGTIASHRLPPKIVVELLKDNGIEKVKLFDTDEEILNALAGSGIEVMIALPNLELKHMGDPKRAKQWVEYNVTRYNVMSKDGVKITTVAIGNEPFLKDYKDMFVNSTLPALTNIQNALNDAGIGKVTKAAIPFNADVYLSPSGDSVPSTGEFRSDIKGTVQDILKEMDKNQAPFIVNIYPFLSAYYGHGQFPLEFAFFDGKAAPLFDEHTGIKYTNVVDAMIDTLVSALKGEGYGNMTVIVGEMGWPTDGDVLANATMASRFYNGLVKHLASNKGTPLRPGHLEVYMFALLDEDEKSTLPGNFERSWGIYNYDGTPKFPLDLSGGVGPKRDLVAAKDVTYLPEKWCQLKSDAENETAIQESVAYACKNGADCTPIYNGSSCSSLDDSEKASFVFNQFFQFKDQQPETCDFGGVAQITTKNISEPTCNFIIQIDVPKESTDSPSPSPSDSPSDADDHKSSSGGRGSYSSTWLLLTIFSIVLAQLI